MTDLTKLTPPEIDERWAEALRPAQAAQAALNGTRRQIARYEKAAGYEVPSYLRDREAQQVIELVEARDAGAPFDAEFKRRGGWARYLLVANSNGHVHRPGCHTLIPRSTIVSPVFELSGQDDEGVVVKCGHTACSHCFKDAPAINAAVRAARDAADGKCRGNNIVEGTSNGRGARCADCGTYASYTPRGYLRAHKRPDRKRG